MKAYFYPKSLHTSIAAFADKFNNMTVRVFDPQKKKIIGVKDVPMTLTAQEKIGAILEQSDVNDVDPQAENYLPRISINLAGLTWDPNRMRGKFERRHLNIEYVETETGTIRNFQTDIQPVPWNLTFEMTVWSKYMIDAHQLLENIAVWYAPQDHVSFKERNFGIEHKSKITLDNIVPNVVFEFGEKERRVIMHNYSFTMETVLYKPIEIRPEIICSAIKIANVPCHKIPFQGDAIILAEGDADSVIAAETQTFLRHLDDIEQYELMAKHWEYANTTMKSGEGENPIDTFRACVQGNCNDEPPEKPVWDPQYLPEDLCEQILQPPRVVFDVDDNGDGTYSLYNQEISNESGTLRVRSYRSTYQAKTHVLLENRALIPNEEYPNENDFDDNGV
jgi:hypothetical protein